MEYLVFVTIRIKGKVAQRERVRMGNVNRGSSGLRLCGP